MTEKEFPIGTKFTTRGKSPRVCTVIDVYKTYNSKDELVRIRYIATHDFLGQKITEHDISRTTIAMGNPMLPTAGGVATAGVVAAAGLNK